METPFFFKSGSYSLFGVLHEPANPPKNLVRCERLGFVFCFPFFEEKLIGHRVMVNMARFLAMNGYYVLRFDYMGHGDSGGNFEDTLVSTCLFNVRAATELLHKKVHIQKIGLLGVRFGGTLAALSVREGLLVDFLILVNPIVTGGAYIDECLRSNLATQLAVYGKVTKTRQQLVDELMKGEGVNIDGYLVRKELYLQMKNVDLTKDSLSMPKASKILILQLLRNAKQSRRAELQELKQVFDQQALDTEFSCLEGSSFWAESKTYSVQPDALYQKILEWTTTRLCNFTKRA